MSFDFKNDPIDNFLKLYKAAQTKGVPEAEAMALATVNSQNQPSVRIVYYKGIVRGGFSFFTNYNGRKSQDINHNQKVSVNFFWPHLNQQIRIEGIAEKLTRDESEKYFATRLRSSQIGAWASNQSENIESYEQFINKFDHLEIQFKNKSIPCPPHWGGYVINPIEIEFWFGKSARLHERYVYQKHISGWNRLLKSP